MTIEIPTELERPIERAAQVRGTNAQAFVIEATRRALEGAPGANGAVSGAANANGESAEEKRLAAIRRLRGCLAGSELSVDEFLRERSEEGRKEAGL